MLSNGDLERLIAEKRCEIETEKIVLGLSAPDACHLEDIDKENRTDNIQNGGSKARRVQKTVRIDNGSVPSKDDQTKQKENQTEIPPDLERYIRRYVGLPVMLKAGEYSPNNPLVRNERGAGGDVLLGLGEYERRRNTLRKLRQQQYREYLDQQAKKKQEAKEQAEKELREREEKERLREEERERARQEIEQQNIEAEQRRCRLVDENVERERVRQQNEEQRRYRIEEGEQRRSSVCYAPVSNNNVSNSYRNVVHTGVQVGTGPPLSVGVQTDDAELYRISPSPTKFQRTQAERELSPRTVVDLYKNAYHDNTHLRRDNDTEYHDNKAISHDNKAISHNKTINYDDKAISHEKIISHDDRAVSYDNKAISHNKKATSFDNKAINDDDRPIQPASWAKGDWGEEMEPRSARRRSYGDFDDRSVGVGKKYSRSRLASDLRHTYMPSLFDADAIHMRNLQAEKEAAARRQCYQQELRSQIQEQQRIREERNTREKMLEAAEMRRLEEQLRMLRAAQRGERDRQRDGAGKMIESSRDFERIRTTLQQEIDSQQHALRTHTHTHAHARKPNTSRSDTNLKLPSFYTKEKLLPFSTNISENSIFNPNYDVDSYLRRNLNPKKETLTSKFDVPENCERNVIVEKALVHDRPKERPREKPKYEPSFLKNLDSIQDETPIPVLRHSPKLTGSTNIDENVSSSGMKLVEDKWKVPAVQKNILKSVPKEDGKSVSILTQLGSIRRQLQLEQLRLDNLMSKSD